MSGKYDDIINLPHHTSNRHPRMPIGDRAAQFSPFAALTGYGDTINEAGRITEERIELSEDVLNELNEKTNLLKNSVSQEPFIYITYFKQDISKNGGAYIKVSGHMKKIDEENGFIKLDNAAIPMNDIINIESEIFLKILDR